MMPFWTMEPTWELGDLKQLTQNIAQNNPCFI